MSIAGMVRQVEPNRKISEFAASGEALSTSAGHSFKDARALNKSARSPYQKAINACATSFERG